MTLMPSAPSELRKTLDDSLLLVRHISTKMETCRCDQQAVEVRALMDERNFDVMGREGPSNPILGTGEWVAPSNPEEWVAPSNPCSGSRVN